MVTNMRGDPSLEDYRLIAERSYDWESWLSPDETLRWTNTAGMAICGYSARECRAMERFPWPLVLKDDHITFELFDHFVGEHRPGSFPRARALIRELSGTAAQMRTLLGTVATR